MDPRLESSQAALAMFAENDQPLVARDRSTLQNDGMQKSNRFPRTSRRETRIDLVLSRRQPTLSVVLEDVHDLHNVSAVLRSCDATGVLDVHLVYTVDDPPIGSLDRATSGSAAKWVNTTFHSSIDACYSLLRTSGTQILATALRHDSRNLYDIDLTGPVAIVFGNERRGASANAVQQADATVDIPMMGMVESLNISVACAVTLYEAFRQRRNAGHYDSPQLSPDRLSELREDWIKR